MHNIGATCSCREFVTQYYIAKPKIPRKRKKERKNDSYRISLFDQVFSSTLFSLIWKMREREKSKKTAR